MCPAARDFFARQGDLTRKYFVYFKSNQRHMAEKDPPFGHVGNFQTSPNRNILILLRRLPMSVIISPLDLLLDTENPRFVILNSREQADIRK